MTEEKKPKTLKEMLLAHLKSTNSVKGGWFVPISVALKGVDSALADWDDGTMNHTIRQQAIHLLFWNEKLLMWFLKGEKGKYEGANDDTFKMFEQEEWDNIVSRLMEVESQLETVVEQTPDENINKIAGLIMNVCSHNAYHTGQIVHTRKLQESWSPDEGVQ